MAMLCGEGCQWPRHGHSWCALGCCVPSASPSRQMAAGTRHILAAQRDLPHTPTLE